MIERGGTYQTLWEEQECEFPHSAKGVVGSLPRVEGLEAMDHGMQWVMSMVRRSAAWTRWRTTTVEHTEVTTQNIDHQEDNWEYTSIRSCIQSTNGGLDVLQVGSQRRRKSCNSSHEEGKYHCFTYCILELVRYYSDYEVAPKGGFHNLQVALGVWWFLFWKLVGYPEWLVREHNMFWYRYALFELLYWCYGCGRLRGTWDWDGLMEPTWMLGCMGDWI